jgi:hypothetical protein
MKSMAARRLSLLALCGVLTACNSPTYFPGTRALVSQAGSGDTDLFVVPVRKPTREEQAALVAEQMRLALPQPAAWAGLRDFDIEMHWSLHNDDMTGTNTATLSLNGGNEFGDYEPALFIDPLAPAEDQVPPPPLMGGTPLTLQGGETRTGVFREDQLAEAGIDLEAIVRYPPAGGGIATPFIVIEHLSSLSQAGLDGVPPKNPTAAMVRLQLTLASTGNVTAEYSVRVRDHSGKLAHIGDMNLYVSTAAMLPPLNMPVP